MFLLCLGLVCNPEVAEEYIEIFVYQQHRKHVHKTGLRQQVHMSMKATPEQNQNKG